MSHLCRDCQRVNPDEASYCYYDGKPLRASRGAADGASIDFATWTFPSPFVFGNGVKAGTFPQLALACRSNPAEAMEVLRSGFLHSFFGSLGRIDLAMAAQAAAKEPDADRGLDALIGKLPGAALTDAKLVVTPEEIKLGTMKVGADTQLELKLSNEGQRLLHGKATIDGCPWLGLGDSASNEKLFQFFEDFKLPIAVRGSLFRANNQPQKAEILIETNGGDFIIGVEVSVPVQPFPDGSLAGSTSPRQLAEKAKANSRDAAVLIENGAVKRWYESNGWSYPIKGPTATGVAAVQQFFELLGLVKPPKMTLAQQEVTLAGKPGQKAEQALTVQTQEKRHAIAFATSDAPWLKIGKTLFRNQTATIPLVVESIPGEDGQSMSALVKVSANGNTHFDVPVTLLIGDPPHFPVQASVPTTTPAAAPTAVTPPAPSPFQAPTLAPATMPALSFPSVEMPAPTPPTVAPPPPAPTISPDAAAKAAQRKQQLMRGLPLGIMLVGLLAALVHDFFFRPPADELKLTAIDASSPLLALKVHDTQQPRDILSAVSMRFGVNLLEGDKGRLTNDEFGRTGNVAIRIDGGADIVLGGTQGSWQVVKEPLAKDKWGNQRVGSRAVWTPSSGPKIRVEQILQLVPGGRLAADNKRRLDTCLVQYQIQNEDSAPHRVGLRVLFDTYVGGRDGVPFTVAGADKMNETSDTYDGTEKVPDFVAALENDSLKEVGAVLQLNLRYGAGIESPSRVTLGAWPAGTLTKYGDKYPSAKNAREHETRWEVPVLPMNLAMSGSKAGNAAVTLYWEDKTIEPSKKRTVGFSVGLGSLSHDKADGRLGMTSGGAQTVGEEFTLTAYVKAPGKKTTITLRLPRGLELTRGQLKQEVPELPSGASSPFSPVSWRVKAKRPGLFRVEVKLSTGPKVEHRIAVRDSGEID